MATLTKEQVEQKMQQLKQLTEEMSALTKELVEAGAIELSEEDLDKATGGLQVVGTGTCPEAEEFAKEHPELFDPQHGLIRQFREGYYGRKLK